MIRAILFCLIFLPSLLAAQPDDFAGLQKTGDHNYTMVYSQYYDGKSLWGYMDGGADLYLEYGFEGLLVQEIKYKGSTIKCEIFKMNSALAAFGIFSVQRHNCKLNNEIDAFHCINNYQVQFAKGNYYISLINQEGDSTAQKVSFEVASWFTPIIEKQDIAFPDHPLFKNKLDQVIYLKGEISMGNVYPQSLIYLESISAFSMWLLPAANKKSPIISIITFEKEEDIKEYMAVAYPGLPFNTYVERKLKKGGSLLTYKLEKNKILQVDGKIGKEIKEILKI